MMSNFFILVKNNCLVFIGSLKGRKNGKTIAAAAIMGLAFLMIGFSFVTSAVGQTSALNNAGVPELSIYMGVTNALTLGILFGLMRSANAPGSRDAELLLSMPLRRVTIVCSKIVSQYVFDAPLMIAIFGSTVGAYYVIADADTSLLLRGLILTLLLPMIPIALSYLLGAVVAVLQRKFKMTGIVTTALLMVLLMGYIFMNFRSSSILATIEGLGKSDALGIIEKFAPLSWLTHFVLDGSLVPVICSLSILILPFAAGVLLFSVNFGKQRDTYKSGKKSLLFASRSPRAALLDKEVKRYLACSIYVFNTAFGPMLLLVGTAVFLVMGPDAILRNFPPEVLAVLTNDLIYALLTGILCFFAVMTATTASSISLEGKQLWILKAHPIRTADIFWAKYMLNILLIVPVSVLATILIGIRMRMNLPAIIGMTAVPVILSLYTAFMGLIMNLLFPRFDWTSETAVVKQSMSVMMSLLVCTGSAVIPFVVFYTVLRQSFGFLGLCAVSIIIFGLLTAGSFLFLKTKGKRIFESL